MKAKTSRALETARGLFVCLCSLALCCFLALPRRAYAAEPVSVASFIMSMAEKVADVSRGASLEFYRSVAESRISSDAELVDYLGDTLSYLKTVDGIKAYLQDLQDRYGLDILTPGADAIRRPPTLSASPSDTFTEAYNKFREWYSLSEDTVSLSPAWWDFTTLLGNPYPWLVAWTLYAYTQVTPNTSITDSAPVVIDYSEILQEYFASSNARLDEIISLLKGGGEPVQEVPPELAPYIAHLESWPSDGAVTFPDGTVRRMQDNGRYHLGYLNSWTAAGHTAATIWTAPLPQNADLEGFTVSVDSDKGWLALNTGTGSYTFASLYAVSTEDTAVATRQMFGGGPTYNYNMTIDDGDGTYSTQDIKTNIRYIAFTGRYLEIDGVVYDFEPGAGGGSVDSEVTVPGLPEALEYLQASASDAVGQLQTLNDNFADFATWRQDFASWDHELASSWASWATYSRMALDDLRALLKVLYLRVDSLGSDLLAALERATAALTAWAGQLQTTNDGGIWTAVGDLLGALIGDLGGALGGLTTAAQGLTGVFPLSIPWDFAGILGLFVAEPLTPVFDFPFPVPASMGGPINMHIDLSTWDGVAELARWGELLLFGAGLALRTRDLVGGGMDDSSTT